MQLNNLFLSLAVLFSFGVCADIADHLKKAENKSPVHFMRNIDFIYMINLDKRPEKFAEASYELLKYGISPYRFSAVNAWELSLENINDVGLKFKPGMTPLMASRFPLEANGKSSHEFMRGYGNTYFCHCMSRGAIGCALSHISILKDAWDSGYETIWVMEDDVESVADPNLISQLLNELDHLVGKENWDVFFTDVDYRSGSNSYVVASGARKRPDLDCSTKEITSQKFTTREKISTNLKAVSARFGTHSMVIRRSGIKKLLNFSLHRQIFLPYDLENYLVPGIKRYSSTFDIVTNKLNSLSDNAAPTYETK